MTSQKKLKRTSSTEKRGNFRSRKKDEPIKDIFSIFESSVRNHAMWITVIGKYALKYDIKILKEFRNTWTKIQVTLVSWRICIIIPPLF
jgi:hypothetical protein